MALTSDFFSSLSLLFQASGRNDIYNLINDNKNQLSEYSAFTYAGLLCLDNTPYQNPDSLASIVYLSIGTSFVKIYSTLTQDYNPYENYFTNRDMTDDLDGTTTRTGGYTDTPSGSKVRTYNDAGNIGQGTTFDDTETWRNINKTTTNGSVNDGFSDYKEQRTFDALKDTAANNRTVMETKSGSSGIFSKQDLTTREVKLRLTYRLIPILVRMCVDYINKGVWYNDT